MKRPAARRTACAVGLTLGALLLSSSPVGAAEASPVASVTTTTSTGPVASSPMTPAAYSARARMRTLLPARMRLLKALGRYRSMQVVDVPSRAGVWGVGGATPMRGASTTKLATAVTALELLGTTTRFPTKVVGGRSTREVVLVGGGDPMLTSSQLGSLAKSTAAALAARVPAAPSPTPTPTPTPSDTTSPSPVDPSPSVPVTPTPTPTPTVTVPPAPTAVAFTVRVDDTLYPAPTAAPGWTRGYVPYVVTPVRPLVRDFRNGSDTAADAARYFAGRVDAELRALLRNRTDLAPKVTYAGRLAAVAGAPQVAVFAGNTSGAALRRMLLVSDNDIAEMLYRNNAVKAKSRPTWASARVVSERLLSRLGVNTRGWVLADGSGVSRSDRLTTRGLVQLLTIAQSPRHPELALLRSMLPVAGVSGTLAARNGRFTTAPSRCARGRIQAKTGTLFDTVGLAGYTVGRDGRLKAFAALVNAPPARYSKLTVRRSVDALAATVTGCY